LTFDAGGGATVLPTLADIPAGSVCTVVEQNSDSFPAGSAVTYTTAGVDTTGLMIGADAVVTVTIINDFSAVALLKGTVELVKTVKAAPAGVALPADYTGHVSCDDGTEMDVKLPGAGGTGSPAVTPDVEADCVVSEDTTSLSPGWAVAYAVDGDVPGPTPPVFTVTGADTITVTITNDPSAVSPVTTTPTTASPTTVPPSSSAPTSTATTEATVAPTAVATLPATGQPSTQAPLAYAVVAVEVGLVLIVVTRRRVS
jgi:hypothetical protein